MKDSKTEEIANTCFCIILIFLTFIVVIGTVMVVIKAYKEIT